MPDYHYGPPPNPQNARDLLLEAAAAHRDGHGGEARDLLRRSIESEGLYLCCKDLRFPLANEVVELAPSNAPLVLEILKQLYSHNCLIDSADLAVRLLQNPHLPADQTERIFDACIRSLDMLTALWIACAEGGETPLHWVVRAMAKRLTTLQAVWEEEALVRFTNVIKAAVTTCHKSSVVPFSQVWFDRLFEGLGRTPQTPRLMMHLINAIETTEEVFPFNDPEGIAAFVLNSNPNYTENLLRLARANSPDHVEPLCSAILTQMNLLASPHLSFMAIVSSNMPISRVQVTLSASPAQPPLWLEDAIETLTLSPLISNGYARILQEKSEDALLDYLLPRSKSYVTAHLLRVIAWVTADIAMLGEVAARYDLSRHWEFKVGEELLVTACATRSPGFHRLLQVMDSQLHGSLAPELRAYVEDIDRRKNIPRDPFNREGWNEA